MEDKIEALEALHQRSGAELHFRFMGTAKNRTFVVDVQFDSADQSTNEPLQPIEHDFMIGRVLDLVLKHMAKAANPGLH